MAKPLTVPTSQGQVKIFWRAVRSVRRACSDRDNAYQLINQELGKRADILKLEMQPVSGIGEQASMLSVKGSSIGIALNVVELVFEQCGAVVNLSLGDKSSLEKVESLVTSYAGRLANRLDTLACQQN